jgi:hypothetical protein
MKELLAFYESIQQCFLKYTGYVTLNVRVILNSELVKEM